MNQGNNKSWETSIVDLSTCLYGPQWLSEHVTSDLTLPTWSLVSVLSTRSFPFSQNNLNMLNFIRGIMKVRNRSRTELARAAVYMNRSCSVAVFKVVFFPLFSYKKKWKISLSIVWRVVSLCLYFVVSAYLLRDVGNLTSKVQVKHILFM